MRADSRTRTNPLERKSQRTTSLRLEPAKTALSSAIQGYEANLNDLLTSTLNYPHIVFNEGIGGDTSEKALGRIDSILERHPGSNKVLILLGTNDAASGVSSEVFRINMQSLTNMVPEGTDVWVALVPPAFDENGVPNSVRNSLVEDYNDVVRNQLTGIQVGPDLYNFFFHRPSLFADELHPNGLGYEAMAYYGIINLIKIINLFFRRILRILGHRGLM